MRLLQRWWRQATGKWCYCGQVQLVKGASIELGGIMHRANVPCISWGTWVDPD